MRRWPRGLIVLFQAPVLWGLFVCNGLAAEPLQDALSQLKSSEAMKRRIGAQELGTLGAPAAGPALIQALSDKDPYVRTLSARGLGFMRWTAAKDKLAD